MKQIIYFLQYIGFIFIYFLYKILPLNLSLKVSSFLFRTFGKFSRANKTAINNCKYVFPNLKDEEIQNIIKKSWNNLGITICELLRINDIFIKGELPQEMSLYVHRPSVTDKTCAPKGDDTFYVLACVPNLSFKNNIYWRNIEKSYKKKILTNAIHTRKE